MSDRVSSKVVVAIMAIASSFSLHTATLANPTPSKKAFATAPIGITGKIITGSGDTKQISCKTISIDVAEYIAIPPNAQTGPNGSVKISKLNRVTPVYRSRDASCQYRISFQPSRGVPATAKRYIDISVKSNVKPPVSSIEPNRVCAYRNDLRLHEQNPIPETLDFTLRLTCAQG